MEKGGLYLWIVIGRPACATITDSPQHYCQTQAHCDVLLVDVDVQRPFRMVMACQDGYEDGRYGDSPPKMNVVPRPRREQDKPTSCNHNDGKDGSFYPIPSFSYSVFQTNLYLYNMNIGRPTNKWGEKHHIRQSTLPTLMIVCKSRQKRRNTRTKPHKPTNRTS